MQSLSSFPPQLCRGIFHRTVGRGSLRTVIQLQSHLARAGTWSCIMGDPALLAAQRSHHSPGEAMDKYEKRGPTLLKPCEDLGQKSKSGRLSVLKPTTPTANNAYSFWCTRGAEGSCSHACSRTLSQSIMLRNRDIPAQTSPHCPSTPVLPRSRAGLQRTDRGGSSGSCFRP